MTILRAWGRQVLLSFVVLDAVFASGFHAGSSASVAAMQDECLLADGKWSQGFCVIVEMSK